jgi:hypothetical protein
MNNLIKFLAGIFFIILMIGSVAVIIRYGDTGNILPPKL